MKDLPWFGFSLLVTVSSSLGLGILLAPCVDSVTIFGRFATPNVPSFLKSIEQFYPSW